MTMSSLVRFVVLVAGAIAIVGCTRVPGASIAPTEAPPATSAPSDVPASAAIIPAATDCVTLYESIDSLDPTLVNLRVESKDVVVGTVVSQGTPFWDSPTGQAPKPSEQLGEGNEFYILTPYTLTVDRTVTGSRTPGTITVVVEGGQIGCDKFEVSPSLTLDIKKQYVLFLKPRLASDNTGATMKEPMVFHAFPMQADGQVLTPLDGAVSLPAFTSALASADQSPAP
jgi:hypothetical protein